MPCQQPCSLGTFPEHRGRWRCSAVPRVPSPVHTPWEGPAGGWALWGDLPPPLCPQRAEKVETSHLHFNSFKSKICTISLKKLITDFTRRLLCSIQGWAPSTDSLNELLCKHFKRADCPPVS
ncbi:hypothetical protein H1C71_032549 [Ictidomys tridecemlineatus]|nr:hypothetical protein H1C71_032549 [Ictidomys tridecemlineatus]KAG3281939.1 hypothetical protein H1C71_032549 [Ictidomys tridecemlineatus]KAG3281940.1 hypothetical protein H1C71_032549 [Ictidomys tridecemlineatus]